MKISVMFHLMILFILIAFFKEAVTGIQNVKILFVNEDSNNIAEKSVEVAMQYINKHSNLEVHVDVQTVIGSKNSTSTSFLQSLCSTYEEMVASQSTPHVVLDTTTLGMVSETVKYFTASLALPTISASFGQEGDLRHWRNIADDDKKYLIQIMPPADIVTEIVKAFVMTQRITNTAILYDSNFVMRHKLKTLLQNISTRHLIVPVNFTDIKTQLIKLKYQDISNFFIFGDLDTITYILEGANEIDFLSRKNAWHIISLSNGDLRCNCTNTTVLFVHPDQETTNRIELLKNEYNFSAESVITSAFYFDLALFTVLAVRDMLNKKVWPQDMKYVTCDDYNHQNKLSRNNLNLKKYFGNNISPTFGRYDITENGWSHMEFNMEISAVTIVNGETDNIKRVGSWFAKFNGNITLSYPNILEPYINDKFYKVVTMEQKPFVYLDKSAPKGYKGYCIDLLEQIAKYCNFKYDIYVVKDGKFGEMNKNGQWDGMVRDLMDNKADIALGSISVSAERENVIDFTVPFYEGVGITVLMKKPLPSKSLFKFLSVLDNEVWLCLMAAYCFTSFMMWLFDRFSPFSYQNNIKKYEYSAEKRYFTFKECLWFCITSLTPQGGGEVPKGPAGKLLAASWWLFGFIIISSYTANLAAFLTVTRLDNPVTSLDELSKQYKVAYAPVNGSIAMTYFKKMASIEKTFYNIWENMSLNNSLSIKERAKLSVWEYPISDKYTKMWQTMKKTGLPATNEEAIQKVRNSRSQSDGFAFIGDGTDIKYLALVNCDLEAIGDEFSKKPLAIGIQKNSPLKILISNAILDMMVKRKLEILKQKWWSENPEKQVCGEEGTLSGGITIRNIAGVFIVVFVGIAIACIGLLIQNRKNICRTKTTKNNVEPPRPIIAPYYLEEDRSRVGPFYVSLAQARFRRGRGRRY